MATESNPGYGVSGTQWRPVEIAGDSEVPGFTNTHSSRSILLPSGAPEDEEVYEDVI